MNSSLPADIRQRIEAQIASGSFATEEDVLREALETLERRQRRLSHEIPKITEPATASSVTDHVWKTK